MTDHSKLPSTFIQNNPWEKKGEKKGNPIWPATAFNLKRNIARFNFPARLENEEMGRLLTLISNAHLQVLGKEKVRFFPAEELSVLDKEFLFEHFLCEESFQNSGNGQGFLVALEGHFLALFNIDDHINLQWIDCVEAWEDTWNQLAKLEKEIGSELTYAFSPKFGFLTSKLANCGTGLTVCAYLHVPVLHHSGQLLPLLHNLEDVKAINMEGQWPSEHLLGDFLLLKNSYTLGVSEEGILRSIHLAATKIAGAEKAARMKIVKESDAGIKDLIARAYGLLAHSLQLNTRETLNALSMIKLGIDLGWITGLSDEEVNAIFLQVRRAHLLLPLEKPSEDLKEVQQQRAAFIHKKLKDVSLKDA